MTSSRDTKIYPSHLIGRNSTFLFVAVAAAAIFRGVGSVGDGCKLREEKPSVCVLGGDDAGTGAAWATSSLGVSTLLVLDHRRNLGGDPASFYHDGAEMVPSGGGVNLKMLQSDPSHTNQRTNNNVAGGLVAPISLSLSLSNSL